MTKRLVQPCRCISTVMGALFPFAFYWNLSAPLACAFSAWWIHYSPPFFFPFSCFLRPELSQKAKWLFLGFPLSVRGFFPPPSLSRQMSEDVALAHLFQTAFQYIFGSMYIRQQTITTLGLFIYLCGNILQLMISGKIQFQIQRQGNRPIHIPQQTNDTT